MGNNHTKDTTVNSSALTKPLKTQSRPPTKPPKIKPLITTRPSWKCSKPSDVAYISKYKPKMLSEVYFTHDTAEQLKARGFRKLRKALMDSKIACPVTMVIEGPNTKHLGSLLSWTNNWGKLMLCSTSPQHFFNQESANILTKIKSYKNLTHLNIYLGYWEKEEKKNIVAKYVENSIRCLTKLKEIDINAAGSFTAVYQGILQRTFVNNAPLLAIKYPASLSSLFLSFNAVTVMNQQLLSQFISNLQPIKSLECLSLGSEFISTELQALETQIWENFFRKTQNLKTLSLTKHIFETNQIDAGPQAFSNGFHHLDNLRVLNIDFLFYAGYGEGPCQTFTTTLYSHLASFPHLKVLSLSFVTMSGSTHRDPPDIFPPLQQLTQLEQFYLRFYKVYNINDAVLQRFTQSIQHLHHLKNLELLVPNYEISYQAIASLAQSLQNLTQLQVLRLYFPWAIQNYHSIGILSKSIAHLNLTSLGLILSCPLPQKTTLQKIGSLWEDPKRLTHFFSVIYGFNLLSTLSLDLSIFDVSIPECKHFALALRELQQLTSLALILPAFDSLNNFETLQYVLASIREMSKLNSFSLSFKDTGLCDRQMRHLIAYLSQYRSVRSLELRFKHIEKLSGEVMRELLLSLRDLPLRSLKIYFDQFLRFEKELAFLKDLKNLDIFQVDMYSASYDLSDPLFTEI